MANFIRTGLVHCFEKVFASGVAFDVLAVQINNWSFHGRVSVLLCRAAVAADGERFLSPGPDDNGEQPVGSGHQFRDQPPPALITSTNLSCRSYLQDFNHGALVLRASHFFLARLNLRFARCIAR